LAVAELSRGFLATDLARAIELATGLDHQFTHLHVAIDHAAANDLQALGLYISSELATDHDPFGLHLSLELAGLANRDFGIGFHRAFDLSIDMQAVA